MALDFFAGCQGGFAGVLVGHPFDTVKVRLQTQVTGQYTGVINCFAQTIKHETVFGLYKGMTSPIVGVSFINAIIFGTQASVMKFLDPGIKSEIIAGGVTGLVQSVICCPVELAKLRIQVKGQGKAQNRQPGAHQGSIKCLLDVHKKQGWPGCYRGMAITVMREIPSFAIYFGTFEYLCQYVTPVDGHRDSIGPLALLFAGGMSGSASWVFTYPIDVIKSRYQADSTGVYSGILDCTKKTFQTGGLRAFSQGLTATILRAFPTNAATFATVVMTRRLFGGDGLVDLKQIK